MELNDEQRKMVEENHNLIYGYIHKRRLKVDEWYGVLAIELCKSVMGYEPERGTLGNYFYMRCDSKVNNIYRKLNAKKRTHNGMVNLEDNEYKQYDTLNYMMEDFGEDTLLQGLLEDNPRDSEMLLLIYQGYTQNEVSELIGLSQAQVSRRLKDIRRRYLEYDK